MKLKFSFAICVLVFSSISAYSSPVPPLDSHSPIGHWKTIDDKTGKPRCIVEVFEQDGKLFGRIERNLGADGQTRTCTKCTDERKGQPIVGMVFMRNLKENGDEYIGGEILDPENGTSYRCKLRLEDGGHKLVVRGYVGVALFGRSQSWERQ